LLLVAAGTCVRTQTRIMWRRHLCVVLLSMLAARGEAQDRTGAAATQPAWPVSKAGMAKTAPPTNQIAKKFPLIKKLLEGKLPSLKLPSIKRAELDAKLTSALAKRHFGLRDLAEKATGALAGAGSLRSLRTGLLPLNRSHVMHLLADAKMACVAEHAALCFKGAADDEKRIAAWAKASAAWAKASDAPTTSDGEALPEQARSVLAGA
tara:strand:- start:464 stop:1087 length:624 start_codon:yes stop_codon:yes gene_type:complete